MELIIGNNSNGEDDIGERITANDEGIDIV